MLHTIELVMDFVALLETSPKQLPERLRLTKGTRLQAHIKPYVVEAQGGPMEMADLFFADGSAARNVRCAAFAFVD